jgi:hypothetical protein
LSGAGTNGFQALSLVEPVFAKNRSNNNEFMCLRVTSNNGDGAVRFQGDSINGLIETAPVEVLNQNDFATKYQIIQDCNPFGEDCYTNVGQAQLTGRFWVLSDGTRRRIWRASFRGRVACVNGGPSVVDNVIATLPNVEVWLGVDSGMSCIQDGVNWYPIPYASNGETFVSCRWSKQEAALHVKLNVVDGNIAPWTISGNNVVITMYYTRNDDPYGA